MPSAFLAHTPKPLAVLISLICATQFAAQAQISSKEGTATLKEVVVSASRQEQATDDLPLSIDVLNATQLEAQQINDIRDVAKDLPNVSVKRAPARFSVTGKGNPVGADGNSGLSIRGQGGNRVIMLVDGVRLPRSYINGSNAFSRDTVAIGLLKRIELVRGPASALYGSDGLAGLVNFITLEPADFLNAVDGQVKNTGGRAWLSYSGDDDGITLGGTLARRINDTAEFSLTATAGHANGMNNMGSNDAANVDRTTPNPQTTNDSSLLGKLVLHPSAQQRHVISLEHVQKNSDVELLSSRAKLPYTGTAAAKAAAIVDESATSDITRNRLTWDARYKLNTPWADQLQTVLSWQDSAAQQDGQTVRNDQGVRIRKTNYQERTWQANVQADKTLHMSQQWAQKITYGVDYASTTISSFADGSDPAPLPAFTPRSYFPDTRDTAQAIYAQTELIHDNWSVTPGVRIDQFTLDVLSQDSYYPWPSKTQGQSLSGSAVSPKLGVLYRVTPQWSMYGNYASGFRAPEGQQVNSVAEVATAVLLANPNLKPEESRNFELGFKARLDRISLDAAVFTSRYTNLIQEKKELVPVNGVRQYQTVNIDKASISGFEIKGHADLGQLAHGKLAASLGYGQTHGSNDSTDLPLNYLEPAKLTLGLAYTSADWDVSLTVNRHAAKGADELDSPYTPKQPKPLPAPPTELQFTVPASTTLDIHGQWRIRKNLRLNLGVVNLTDQKYWNWSDVQGLASNPTAPLLPVVDAYTQPGRHVNLSLVADF